MALLSVRLLAIVFSALALIAPAAHLFELANKIAMTKADYFVVQGIYRGWWLAGGFLLAAFVANVGLAVATRHQAWACRMAVTAAILIVANLTIFFVWTQPANAATQNWTIQPENWEAMRRQWEISHAINAGVMFAAFVASVLAALKSE